MGPGYRMYEEKWHRYTKPDQMIYWLSDSGASPRKLRLFACACFRNVWGDALDVARPGVAAVIVAENFADGRASADELRAAFLAANNCHGQKAADENAAWAASGSASGAAYLAGSGASNAASRSGTGPRTSVENWLYCTPARIDSERSEASQQADLLRDIFNPFRPVQLDPAWLSANDRAIERMARQIYDRREFDRLPALAEALAAAGCTNDDIVNHCRAKGPHVRGCWAVDLLLGLE